MHELNEAINTNRNKKYVKRFPPLPFIIYAKPGDGDYGMCEYFILVICIIGTYCYQYRISMDVGGYG